MECKHKILLKSGIIVPCGKCPSCLANQRQEWIFRLQQEFYDSVFALFVTLTYNDEHLPLDMSVNKRDVQLFNKRLRKHFPPGDCRFYVVSEYGENGTLRPHYHGLYFFKSTYDKKFVYDIFEQAWQNGFVSFGDVEEGSIVYCTKYCLKHSTTPFGRRDTFRLMSKMNGGLGAGYLERMGAFHRENNIYEYVAANGKRSRMPKYFKDKLVYGNENLTREYYEQQEEKRYIRISSDFEKSFREFLLTHHYDTIIEAKEAFNAFLLKRAEAQDSLVKKHCKKQKL